MANQDLRILLSAQLNIGRSISDINAQISGLEKKVKSLKLKIDIDTKILDTLTKFSKNINKITQSTQSQSNAIKDTTKTINQETQAINAATEAQKKWNLERKKTVSDAQGTIKRTTETYGDGVNQRIIDNKMVSGGVIQTNTDIINKKKMLDEEKKIDSERVKNANETNKIRKAISDKATQDETKRYNDFVAIKRKEYEAQKKAQADAASLLAAINKAERDVMNLNRKYGSNVDSAGLASYLNQIKALNSTMPNFKSEATRLQNEISKIGASAKTATSHTLSFGDALKTAFQKFPIWMLATTAFYAPIRAFQEGIKQIYELDTAMTNLQKVTNATSSEYRSFLADINKTSTSLGVLTVDLIKATTEWARLGYTMEQAKTLGSETVVYANVGDMGAEDASKALISAIKGFGIEVDAQGEKVRNVVDIYNEVGNKYAISSAGIGEALRRSASSLKNAGNTIEESVAMVTAANSTLQDPASVGTALKTVSMRLRGISEDGEDVSELVPTLEKKFNSLGLSLKKDDNTFKSTFQIMKDLAELKAKGMTDFQLADITELVAGKRQGNVVASLLDNWKDAESSLKVALNSTGSAARENAVYLESLKAKVAQFKNEVIGFWNSAIAVDTLKGFIQIGVTLVKSFGSLTNAIGFIPATLLTATVAFSLFSTTVRTFIASSGSQMLTWLGVSQMQFLRASVAVKSFAMSLGLGSNAAKIFTISLMGIGRAVLPLAVITGVTYAISELMSYMQKLKAEEKDFQTQQNAIANNWSTQKDKISALITEYQRLNEARSPEQEQRYLEITSQLATLMPNLVASIDEKGTAHLKNADAIAKELVYAQRLSDLDNGKKVADTESNVEDTLNKRAKLLKEIAAIDKKIDFGFGSEDGRAYKLTESEIISLKMKRLGLEQQISGVTSKLKDDMASIVTIMSNMGTNKAASESLKKYVNDLDMTNITSEEAIKKMFDISEALNNIKSTQSSGILSPDQEIAYANSLKLISNQLHLSDEELNNFINSLNGTKTPTGNAKKETLDFAQGIQKLNSQIEKSDESISSLASAYQKLQDGEQLTTSEILKLTEKYPELLNYLVDHNGLIEDKGDILQKVAEIERNARLTEAKNLLDSVTDTFNALESKRKMYEQFYTKINPFVNDDTFLSKYGAAGAPTLTDVNGLSGLSAAEQRAKAETEKQLKEMQLRVQLLSKPIDLASYGKKPDKEKQETQSSTLHTPTDFSKEEIDNINSVIHARENNIKSLEKQIQTASKADDYNKVIELTNQLLTEQSGKLTDINSANSKLSSSAQEVRDMYKSLSEQFSEDGVGFDQWFNDNGTASSSFIKSIQDIDKAMSNIEGDGKNLTVQQKNQIKELDNQKELYQKIFNQIQQFKQSWSGNVEEIQKVNDVIEGLNESLAESKFNNSKSWIEKEVIVNKRSLELQLEDWKRVQSQYLEGSKQRMEAEKEIYRVQEELSKKFKTDFDKIMDETSKAITETIDNLKKQLSADPSDNVILNTQDLTVSIDAILAKLNEVDSLFPNGLQVIDTSNDARAKLDNYKNTIVGLSNVIREMSNESTSNADQLKNSIEKQIAFSQDMKSQITSMKQHIASMTTMYQQQEASISNQIKLHQKQYDLIIENLKKQLEVQDTFNLDEFSDSIASIISDLNSLDGIHGQGNFIESTLGTREELDSFKAKILEIAKAVSDYQNATSSPTQGSIQNEITFVNGLKTKIDALNNSLRDTELKYKNEEKALENLITTQTKYYDDQIKAQQEALKNLDEQIEKEDRLKKLQDINDEINKTKADKRFSFINKDGVEELTFDKGKVSELEKQRDELLKQYQRDDLKKAIQDNIDNLEKAKNETITKLQEQLDKTKQIHQIELDAQRLYIQNLQNLYQIAVNDVNSKIEKLKGSYDNEIANEQERLTQLQAVHQQELDSMNMYVGYLSSLDASLVANTQSKIEQLKVEYENEQKALIDHFINLNDTTKTGSKKFNELVEEWKTSAISKLDSMVSSAGERLRQMQAIMAAMAAMSGVGGGSSSRSGAEFVSIGKYHTGTNSVGEAPLASNEMPAILQLSETVLTKMQSLKLEDIIIKPLDYLSRLASSVKLPTFTPNLQTAASTGNTTYNLHGVTIVANNPTEMFEGLRNTVKSHKT